MSLKAEQVRAIWEDLKSRTSDCPYCDTEWPEHTIADCPYKAMDAALAEADGPTPWAYAIETPGGDMYDGEYAVFGDKHSAQDQVDCLNDDLDESEEQYKLVPLFRGEPSPAAEGTKGAIR